MDAVREPMMQAGKRCAGLGTEGYTNFDAKCPRRYRAGMISVRKIDGETFEVTVVSGATTKHRVNLKAADRVRLAGEETSAERLIEESFRFLLDREPNTSILSRFDLPVIGQYFPEYTGEMRRRFGAR